MKWGLGMLLKSQQEEEGPFYKCTECRIAWTLDEEDLFYQVEQVESSAGS